MTDVLSAEDIKKAIGAFAGEQCTPLPSPVPLPSSRVWGTLHPSAKPPQFLPSRIGLHPRGLALWFFAFQELHGLCSLTEPHKVEGAKEWPLWEDSWGSRTKREDKGGEKQGPRLPL